MELGDINAYDNNRKHAKIPPRDKNMKEVLDLIEIDLPTKEEAKFLSNIDVSLISSHTDLAALTGGINSYSQFYIKGDSEYYPRAYGFTKDGTGVELCKNGYRNNGIALRPVLRFNKCPELWEKIIENIKEEDAIKTSWGTYSILKFGSMPMNAPSKEEQKVLNKAFNDGSRDIKKQNDEGFIFEGVYIHGQYNDMKSFRPVKYPKYSHSYEYGFASRFYINYKVHQNYQGENWADKLISSSVKIKLSNGVEYKNGKNVWIRISSIPWIVDFKHKALISKNILLAGLRDRDCKWYLDNYMKYEILCHEGKILDYKRHMPIKVNTPEETDEITKILIKIKENMKYYFGDKEIKNIVDKLIENYNDKLDEIRSRSTNTLELTIGNENNPEELRKKLISDLQNLLFEVETNGEKVKNYHDMIDILNECKKDKINTSKDELCPIINTIKTVIIEFITDEKVKEKLKKELDQIITNNINRNKSYINEFKNNDNARTRTLDELKLEFRKDLHPFLENLSKLVEKQDLVNEIINDVNIMISNTFTVSKNKIVKNYLNILNEIISKIKDNGTSEDRIKLKSLVNIDFGIYEDTNIIIRKLESMIIDAFKLELTITERNKRNRRIDALKFNHDTSNIFNDNNQTK